jgi:hypothetical protein
MKFFDVAKKIVCSDATKKMVVGTYMAGLSSVIMYQEKNSPTARDRLVIGGQVIYPDSEISKSPMR